MTLVFPISTGGTFDRLPADQTLKHGAHDFNPITLIPYPTCPMHVLFMERQIDDAWLALQVFRGDSLVLSHE